MPRNAGVIAAALADVGFAEMRLVKVVGLSIQQTMDPSGIAEFGGEKDIGHGGAAGAGCGRLAGI